MRRVRVLVLICLAAVAAPVAIDARAALAGSAESSCFGDCDGNGVVAINELVLLVGFALGSAPVSACPLPDLGGAPPTIVDLIRAVDSQLGGCAEPSPNPTARTVTPATASPSGSSTPTTARTVTPASPSSPTRTATRTPTERPGEGRLTSERILRIEFGTTPPFVESLPNTLYALLGDVERIAPFNAISGALYDGDSLHGVSTSSSGCCGTGIYSFDPVPVTWKAPGSPWDFPAGDPAVVDFTALHDGSIDGRIDITIDSGAFDLNLQAVALRFIFATSSNGGSSIPPAPLLRSVRIVPAFPGPSTPTATPSATALPRSPTAAPSATISLSPTAAPTPSPTFDDD